MHNFDQKDLLLRFLHPHQHLLRLHQLFTNYFGQLLIDQLLALLIPNGSYLSANCHLLNLPKQLLQGAVLKVDCVVDWLKSLVTGKRYIHFT